ncbi:hypothetical protein IGB42_03106 [Andreprevotia sp. IGB-42]|uniref:type IV pilus modification protein PilV n=1 Tax=Andreprevotia sp. IGB-42 TaxID=2497473 RepID=UPI0013594892|nr:type IV pilus modification protein PilV [Andreprevotia sp. IGB-42]KAF0812438.1 hypothetical protein IGB42_03106 [Andreprevotia sp. IGB-42]
MKQRGMIMIEVLVSIIILSVGILGLASLQGFSLRNSHSSYLRTVATDLAVDMSERIRANRSVKQGVATSGQALDEKNKPIPLPPDYARLVCTLDAGTSKYGCVKPTGYTPPTGTAGQNLAETEDVPRWLDLVRASLPLGSNGGAIICRDTTPDDGSTPVFDVADSNYTSGTGCLAPSASAYANAPYVIKIWWQDEPPTAADPTPALTRFSTTL